MFLFRISSILFILTILLFVQSVLSQENAKNILPPYTLSECYELSANKSEDLKIRDQQLNVARALYKETLSGIYPQISYDINQTIRDNVNFGRVDKGRNVTIDDPSGPIGGSGGILGRTQIAGTVALTQPLFTGFREYLLSDAAEKDTDRIRLQNIRAKELLYKDIADLFYQIVYVESELKVIDLAKSTLESRIKELDEFIKLGKSRESEVVASRSDIADLDTTKEQLKGMLAASKELLAFFTGLSSDQLKLENKAEVKLFDSVEKYIEISKERSDIKASQILIKAEEMRLTATHRERWPQVGLAANAYTFDDPNRNREWDVFVQLSLPLFDGGAITARTEAGEARLRSATLQAKELVRLAERDIRIAFENVKSAKARIASLATLKSTTRKNYELQKKDYANGVVTNLEVLQALRQLQETERRMLQTESLYQTNLVALKVTAGGMTL